MVGIGEHIWLGEIDENSFHNIDDPNCERRKKVSHRFVRDFHMVFLCALFGAFGQKPLLISRNLCSFRISSGISDSESLELEQFLMMCG